MEPSYEILKVEYACAMYDWPLYTIFICSPVTSFRDSGPCITGCRCNGICNFSLVRITNVAKEILGQQGGIGVVSYIK
jgi:hypothetical protein